MHKSSLILTFLFIALISYGQTCSNPSARIERLSDLHLKKNDIYQWVKTDLEFIQPQQHDTIADIGSYDGYYPLIYSIFTDSTNYYLNDISESGFVYFDKIKAICTKIKGNEISNNFTIVIGQDDSTNLKDHQFNKIVVRDALHHFKSINTMLTDIKRIMKPNASLILYEPIRGRNINTESLCKGAMTAEDLLILLNKNGFALTRELSQNIGGSWFEFKQINK